MTEKQVNAIVEAMATGVLGGVWRRDLEKGDPGFRYVAGGYVLDIRGGSATTVLTPSGDVWKGSIKCGKKQLQDLAETRLAGSVYGPGAYYTHYASRPISANVGNCDLGVDCAYLVTLNGQPMTWIYDKGPGKRGHSFPAGATHLHESKDDAEENLEKLRDYLDDLDNGKKF